MLLLYLLSFILLVYGCIQPKIKKDSVYYMSKDSTNVIKGLFIIFVIIRHITEYIDLSTGFDVYAKNIDSFLGQLIVVMFLFYSGYGVMESYLKKGVDYIKTMPKKRILNTLINFDVAVVIFTIVSLVMGTASFSVKRFLLSLVAWDSYGNSNWYIFCILAMYLCVYFVFKFWGKSNKLFVIAGVWFLTFCYIWVLRYIVPRGTWWYDTAVCFPLGCTFSMLKNEFEKIINSNIKNIVFVILMVLVFILSDFYSNIPHFELIMWFLKEMAFVLMIVGVTKLFPPKNIILRWLGENLFPIYIYQRLPMMIFKDLGKISNDLYLFLVVLSVLSIAFLDNYIHQKLRTIYKV